MPNVKHLPVCPYYQGEANMSIKCEDTYRTFIDQKRRQKWCSRFCDKDWEACRYARELNETYDRYYEGDKMALKNHEINALKSEMKGLSTHLGRAKSRIERQQTRIDEQRQEIEDLKKVNENLDNHRRRIYQELQKTKKELEQVNLTIYKQIIELRQEFTNRLAYMMETFNDCELKQNDVDDWVKAQDQEWSILGTWDEKTDGRKWIVVYEPEKEDKDEQLLGEAKEE